MRHPLDRNPRRPLRSLRVHSVAPYSPQHVLDQWEGLTKTRGPDLKITHDVFESIAPGIKNTVRIATDIYGALSYRTDFDLALRDVLSTLETGGDLFFVLQKFISNADLLTKILDVDGLPITMEAYLRKFQGVELVSSELTADRTVAFHLRRTEGPLVTPRLKLIGLDGEKTPPRRTYELVK